MSEQDVNPARMLFAVVERWVRSLRVREVEVAVHAPVHAASLAMAAVARDVPLAVTAAVADLAPLAAAVALHDALSALECPRVNEARLAQLQVAVAAADLSWTAALDTADVPCHMVVAVRDAGGLPGAGAIRYEVRSRDLPFRDLQAGVRALATTLPAVVRDQPAAVQCLTIRRAPLQLSFLSQGEQLVFWKAAVRQTRRTARQLRLVGVYPAIPIGQAGGLRIDSRSAELLFQPVPGGSREATRLQDVAVFQDMVEERAVIVVP